MQTTSTANETKDWLVCPECQFELNPANPYHQEDCSKKPATDAWVNIEKEWDAICAPMADAEADDRTFRIFQEQSDRFIRKHIEAAYQAGSEEMKAKAIKILEDELALAHTTTSGKTSRLTSALNRLNSLPLTETQNG